jgi:hypothetical protein
VQPPQLEDDTDSVPDKTESREGGNKTESAKSMAAATESSKNNASTLPLLSSKQLSSLSQEDATFVPGQVGGESGWLKWHVGDHGVGMTRAAVGNLTRVVSSTSSTH